MSVLLLKADIGVTFDLNYAVGPQLWGLVFKCRGGVLISLTPYGGVKGVSPSLIILTTNCCQLDHITERKKIVVCRTATRVAVGL